MDKKSLTKAGLIALKLLISGGLIYFLFTKIGIDNIKGNLSRVNPLFLLAAVLIYLSQLLISTKRWSLLIERKLPFFRLYSLYMIGAFFGIFLPGIVGGDTVKAYYLNRMLKGSQGEAQETESPSLVTAIASVFMDRYIGFIAMMLLVIGVFPFGMTYLAGTPFLWLLPLVIITFVLFSTVFVRFRIGQRISFISNFYTYFSFYITKKGILAKTLILSFFTQMAGIIAVYALSIGLGMNLPFITLLVFLPIIILVSFLPLSISGIGLREGAFVFFFRIISVPDEQSITLSILWFLSTCAASLFGLIEYFRIKDRQ